MTNTDRIDAGALEAAYKTLQDTLARYVPVSYHELCRLQPGARAVLAPAIEAYLAALPADTAGWRTIDSAPKDGRPILVTNAGEGMLCRIVEWRDKWRGRSTTPENAWCIVHSDNACMGAPTHWRPLAAAPPSPAGGKESRE